MQTENLQGHLQQGAQAGLLLELLRRLARRLCLLVTPGGYRSHQHEALE
jgi:hypothetical protein